MPKVGLGRAGTLLLVLGVASGCGKSSGSTADDSVATGGVAGVGAGSSGAAGSHVGAGTSAGGSAAGSAPEAEPCPVPLSDWEPVQGDVFEGLGNTVATHDYVLASSDAGSLLFPISAEAPEAMTAPITIDANIGSPQAAWQGDGALFVLGTLATGALLARVESSGHATTVDIPGALQAAGRSAVAQAGERVAVAGGDGAGTFLVHLFDDELGPIKSFTLPKHSFGSLTADAQGLRLAVIDSTTKALELYRFTDAELTLERSEPLPGLPLPFTVAWVGDSVVVEINGKLVLVDSTGSQTSLEPPSKDGTNYVYSLSTSSGVLGNVLGATVSNAPFVGRLQGGTLEWAGPGEQCVFADVRADTQSLGVYYLATLRNRTLAYFGFKCPAP
ncbi:MAG TPA: hypothetical protein VHP33_20650 [Polyangiaceae bacterium]|nr:hypothetical protein [Polyangiaceae bacterium]